MRALIVAFFHFRTLIMLIQIGNFAKNGRLWTTDCTILAIFCWRVVKNPVPLQRQNKETTKTKETKLLLARK
jgi:hypothetical protein